MLGTMDRDETNQPEANPIELEDLPERTEVEAADTVKGGSTDDWQLLASKPKVIAVSHS